ncbi:hypothetical protein BAE44_0017879 [Dichanthelium oligosanthes]|uniref:Uncharacterized protein n=1 Tax=Dichanthelium oligosanthes TaxID=888268 RepID=A0A1E5V7I3_9POAL|nr:hypothetical protein BAE44_0017879 [Dichanthelium oligosanthes]
MGCIVLVWQREAWLVLPWIPRTSPMTYYLVWLPCMHR